MSVENVTPNEQLQATQHIVSENDYRLLQILKAAEESERIFVNYPPDGKVRGWVLVLNGKDSKEVRTNG